MVKKTKGKSVKNKVKAYYKYHKRKAKHSGRYIAGAIACKIRRARGKSCNPKRKNRQKRL